MASSPCSLIPMVFLLLLISYSSASPEDDTKRLINDICSKTDDPNFCQDVYNENLHYPIQNARGLCQIAISQTLLIASSTAGYLHRLASDTQYKSIQNIIKGCENEYQNVVNQFLSVSLAFAKGDYINMISYIQKCGGFVSQCQIALGSNVPLMMLKNKQNKVLIEMSLASGNLIGKD